MGKTTGPERELTSQILLMQKIFTPFSQRHIYIVKKTFYYPVANLYRNFKIARFVLKFNISMWGKSLL